MSLLVDAVIVAWEAGERIGPLVEALRADTGIASIVVVDNASGDGTASAARTAGAEVIVMPTNAGYARAANAGTALGTAPFVAILNDDLRFDRGKLSSMLPVFDDAGIAIAGPRLLRPDGSVEPSTHGAPTPSKILLQRLPRLKPWARGIATAVSSYAGTAPGRGLLSSAWPHDRRADVDEVCGACLLARRTAWRELAGFDEAFPFGVEDADLCARARAAGMRVLFDPRLEVTHLGGLGRRRAGAEARRRRAKGWRIYAKKHYGAARQVLVHALTAGA